MKRSRFLACAMLVAFGTLAWAGGADGKKSFYVGGTIPGLFAQSEGVVSTDIDESLVFSWSTNGARLRIPFKEVTGLSFGPTVGSRVPVAILVSRKRSQYLTVNWIDEAGKEQAAVFELGKEVVSATLAAVQERSGRQIEFQTEEARQASKLGSR